MADADTAEIQACLNRAKALKDRRNAVVHSLFMNTGENGGLEAMKPVRKSIGYNATPITIEEMEAIADEVTVLRDDMFSAGWNAGAAKLPGMRPIPPRAPGQKVNGASAD
ncbi:hypothetical protein [Streptomyces sp. KR55]|uniref:hypothetical protein n=1 Tax=Streptomyces sp. KR55 TaxID=3457425 RepID=UPI003FD008F5